MKYSRTALGLLNAQYRSVLRKCFLINAGLFALGAIATATPANAEDSYTPVENRVTTTQNETFTNNSFSNFSATSAGGAINNEAGYSVNIVNSLFENNQAINPGHPYGGAINNDTNGTINISGSKFISNSAHADNDSIVYGGAIRNQSGKITITDSEFIGNSAYGSYSGVRGGAIWNNDNMTVSGSVFQKNKVENAGNPSNVMGSAIQSNATNGKSLTLINNIFGGDSEEDGNVGTSTVVANHGVINLEGNTFKNNSSLKEGVLNFQSGNAKGTFSGKNSFESNKGNALYVFGGTSGVTFKDGSTTIFSNNDATWNKSASYSTPNGGAIYNTDTTTFEDGSTVNFTGNKAVNGGAVYNAGTIDFNGNATFSENTDSTGANDIYNAGTINFGGTADLAGGIDGSAGTVNVSGDVKVAKALKNQTVNVNAGELALNAANVSGSTINLASDAVLNTINNAIEDYSSIQLADNSNIKVDANLGLGQMDLFSALYGHDTVDLNVVEANMIGTSDEEVLMQLVNNGVKVNTSSVIYNWDDVEKKHTKTGIVGSGNNDGKVKVSNGATVSNLEVAAHDTSSAVKESVVYEMGESENFGTETIENATFVVEGNNQSVNVSGKFGVDNKSVVTINDATFNGEGSIDSKGKLRINDSYINVNVNLTDHAILESDPTEYSAKVSVDSTSTATFDEDTFTSTAELANAGTANLSNVTFEDGSIITGNGGTGALNFTNGTTTLGATVADNTLNIQNGASVVLTESGDIDGLALANDANGGTIDLRNNKIDTLGSTALSSTLNVLMDIDLNADTSDNLGTISGTGGLNLTALELLKLGSDTENIQIATAGTNVTLSSNAENTLKTYYSNVSYDSGTGILTLSGKNASASADLVGTWGTGNYIKAYSATDSANTSVGANLTILDEQVKTNEDAISAAETAIGGINDDITVATAGNYIAAGTEVANNLTALDAAVSGKQNALTAGSGIDITSDTISVKNASLANFDASKVTDSTEVAALLANPATASDDNILTEKAVVTGIGALFDEKQTWVDNTLGIESAHSDAVKEQYASTNYLKDATTLTGADKALDTQIKANADAIASKTLTVDTTTGIATIKDGTTTANVYTKEAAEAIFNEKQQWVDDTLGIKSAHADAVKEQYAGTNYLADATTLTGADKALDAAIATKQDKLIAGQGIAIAADGKTVSVKLADTTTTKSGLQLSDDGLSVKVGDSLAISNEGYVDIKANSSQFEIKSATGLNLADNAVTSSKIANGAVTFDKLASDAVATSITGATNKVATDAAVQSYVNGAIGNAITFNADNTVTLKVGSDSANVYDTTGTANYVKANAQSADYIAATSGAVDLTSNSTIAQALQTLDAKKASLAQDNTFTGANTFKSDSGITIQNKTTPAISSNLVATQLNIGTDTHDVLQLTVSDSTDKGSALYVKDANVVTNSGFMALDENGKDRFSADKDGIELKNASGDTTFSVKSATGNVTVAGTMDIEGDTTIGDNFSVKAADGSFSAAGGKFTVDENGNLIAQNITGTGLNISGNSYLHNTSVDGSLNVSGASYLHNTSVDGTLNVSSDSYLHNTSVDGSLNVSGASYLHNTSVDGTLNVSSDSYLHNTSVDGTLNVSSDSYLHNTSVDGSLNVSGDSYLKNTNIDGNLGVTGDATVVGTAKVGALTFNGTDKVNAIDTGTAAITDGEATTARKETMATVATVAKTVGNLAALENTHGVTSAADVASAINSLATNVETATGGTFSGATWTGSIDGKVDDGTSTSTLVDRTVAYGTISDSNIMDVVDQLYANVGNTAITGVNRAATLAAATTAGTKTVNANIDALDAAIGNLDYTGGSINYALANGSTTDGIKTIVANIGTATTAAKGNITSSKSVNANLDQLDEAIGDRRDLGSANEAINQGTKTSVAAGMRAVGDAIGDMNFAGSHYVAGNNDLSGAVRSLDSNLYRVESDLRDLRRDFRRGMASMSAMSALVPNPRAHGNTSLAIGTGAYDGHTAAAIGGFHYLTDNIMLNAGVAWGNSSDAAYRMGVTFSW